MVPLHILRSNPMAECASRPLNTSNNIILAIFVSFHQRRCASAPLYSVEGRTLYNKFLDNIMVIYQCGVL